MNIHIGEKIKEVVANRGMSKVVLGQRLKMTSTNIHKIFKRETIDTGLLQKLCAALEYDFFQYYYGALPQLVNEEQAAYGKNARPEAEISVLKLEMAKKEINYLKKINALLEEKGNSTL
jgi:DNA-binding Xre family transcriptional regulator